MNPATHVPDIRRLAAKLRMTNAEGQHAMKTPPIVSPQEWEAAREQLLVKEKALTRARDALAAERRRMPWLAVEKAYVFDGPDGKASLLDLFEGRRQLIVYRAFFEPGVHGWPEHACIGCSLGADQVCQPRPPERARHDPRVCLARAAGRHRAPEGADGLGTSPGTPSPTASTPTSGWMNGTATTRSSATASAMFRTYFINSRGDEAMGTVWSYLDMTALGRQETWEDSPEGYPAEPAVQVVELARQLRPRRRARPEMGRGVGRRRGRLSEPRQLNKSGGNAGVLRRLSLFRS